MEHFGHENWKTTRGYFLTFADDDLQADVDKQVTSEGQRIIHEILSSPFPLQGGRGKELERHRRDYPVLIFSTQKQLVRTLERGHKIRIGPQSLCMAEKNGQLCPQDCLYEEEKCLSCHNGVVAHQHVAVWCDMWKRGKDLLGAVPAESPAAIVTAKNLSDIEEAILVIGGEVPS